MCSQKPSYPPTLAPYVDRNPTQLKAGGVHVLEAKVAKCVTLSRLGATLPKPAQGQRAQRQQEDSVNRLRDMVPIEVLTRSELSTTTNCPNPPGPHKVIGYLGAHSLCTKNEETDTSQ